jgi:hypothetical protein
VTTLHSDIVQLCLLLVQSPFVHTVFLRHGQTGSISNTSTGLAMDTSPRGQSVDDAPAAMEPTEGATRREPRRRRRLIGLSAVAIGAAFSAATIIMASGITMFVLVIAGWVFCPYLILWRTGERISSVAAEVSLLVALLAIVAFGIWAFAMVDEDAQGGLLLLFAPGYQLAAATLGGLITLVIDRVTKRR